MSPVNFKIIVQARTNSSRLPQKIIRPVDGDQSFLHILLSRLQTLEKDLGIVIATSDQENDDIIEQIGKELKIPVFRGSENNVLDRFIQCAKSHDITHVVRICSDNPFIDLESIKKLVHAYKGEDYLSFSIDGNPSILTHYGFFAEVVSLDALIALQKAERPECIEHVTNCIYTNPEQFNVRFIPISISSSSIRCTLDTKEDFETLKTIYFEWYKKTDSNNHDYNGLIKFINKNPSLLLKMEEQIKQNSK